MSLDGAKLRYVDESGLPVVVAAKGRTFQVGSYLSCDLVLDGPQVEEVLCEIKCDAFGRVTINNKSRKEPIHLNDKVVYGKRPLLHGGRITILNQIYTWEFPKTSEAEDVPRTPERLSPIEQASNSCPSLKLHSHRPQIDKRLTVHNFRYCINSDDEGNTSIESRDQSDAHVEADESQRCKTPPNADDEPAATASAACQTPKVDLLDATQNKENTATPPASHKKLLKLCALSDVVITSFSPRETGVKTEKSFTCVRKPSTPTISTPKSVYSTPKSVLSELNEDSCSRDLLDFSTPSTSKKARRETSTSMYLIDLTTPQKLRPTLKLTPISVSDSADESSDVTPLVIDITKSDTPPSPAPSHQLAKTPKRLAAAATPKRTPQSLMKRALLTSTKKQIAANRVEATTPVATPKRPSLLEARRQCLTTPRRLPFHPQKRTPAQRAADQEKAKTPSTSPRKRPSLFFVSPRENKLSKMRKSLAVARRSPHVEMSNKLVAKARRSLSNSPRDGSPKPGSTPRIGSPRHGSPKPALSITRSTPQTSESEGKALNISKSKCSTPEKLDDSDDNLSRTFTINDHDDDECGEEPIKAGSSVEAFAALITAEMDGTEAVATKPIEDSLKSPSPVVAAEEPSVDTGDAVEETPVIDDSICEEVLVDLPEKSDEGAVVIEDSICEEVPTDPKSDVEAAEVPSESSESLKTNKQNEASAVEPSPVEQPDMGVEKVAPSLKTPLPRRSSRRLSADQRIVATTPRRSTRRASVEVKCEKDAISQRTRRASFSSADTQALATPTRKRRLTEDMGTPTRQSKRLLNTPKRTNLVDESVGDMGAIVEEVATADDERAAAEDEDYGTELVTDEPDHVDYHGLRDLLKTPKNCSTPLFKGLRELMQTPKMPASPILGNIEELLEASDSVSDTPRRSRQRPLAEGAEGRDLDKILKTPSAKNIMVPNEPASAVLHSRKESNRDSVVLRYDLSVGGLTLPLDNIFHDVPSTSAAHVEDTETEINVTTVSMATDADPLAAYKQNDSVSSEDLMNLSAAPTYSKTATTSTTYKAAIRADLELSTLTEEGGEASRPTSSSVNDISGIQLLDQTSDSMFSDPLIVSVSGVESGGVTVEETKVQTIRPPSVPIPGDDRSDTDSIIGMSEPLVFSDDEEDAEPTETIAEHEVIPKKKVGEEISSRFLEEPSEYAATDATDTNGKDVPRSVEESMGADTPAVDSSVDEISLIEVQDITAESSINATKPSETPGKTLTLPNDSSLVIELDSSEGTEPPQAKATDVSSVLEATTTESESYPLDSSIEYSAIELNVSSCSIANASISSISQSSATPPIASKEIVPGVSPQELPEESAGEKSEVEVDSSPKELADESTTDKVTERTPLEETSERKSPIKRTPEDTDEQEKVTCEESPAPKGSDDIPSVENSLDIVEQTPEANKTPAEASLVEEGTEEENVQGVSAVVNAIQDTFDSEDQQILKTVEREAEESQASIAPETAEEPESEAVPAADSASEPAKEEAHSLEDDANVVDVTQEISIAENRKEAETLPEDGKIHLDAFSVTETVDESVEESIIDQPQVAEAASTEESLIEVVPDGSLVKEVPDESLVEEVPEESFVEEESLIEDVPEESLVKEVPEESLVEEVPEESLVEEESLIEVVPEESLVKEVPDESLVEEVPEESLVKEVPEESLVEEAPEESLVEDVPEESLIEVVPEESLIEEVSEESLVEEVPEESLIEENQDDSIALETTLDEIRSEVQQTNGPSQKEKDDGTTLDVPTNAEANEKPAAGVEVANAVSAEPNNLDESTAVDPTQDISLAEKIKDRQTDEVIQLDASNRLEDVSTIEEMPEPEACPVEVSADKMIKEDAIQEDAKQALDTTKNESPSGGEQSNGQDVETDEKPASSDESLIEQPEEVSILEASRDMDVTQREDIPEVVNEAERSPPQEQEPARENGNDVIQLDASNNFEYVEEAPEARKPPSDEPLKAADEEVAAQEAKTLPLEEPSVQRKSTNEDKVITVEVSGDAETRAPVIEQSFSDKESPVHTTEEEKTDAISAVDPKATPTTTAAAIELPKESETMSTSDAEVIQEAATTNEVAAVQEDSTPDEPKVQEKIAVTPELNIQQETETETEPEAKAELHDGSSAIAEAQESPPSVEESAEVVKELPQSSPEKETSQTHLESSKGPVSSAPIAIAEESSPLPAVEEPVNHSLPEKEEERAEIRSEPCKEPVPNAPPPIEEPLGEVKELSQSSSEREEVSAVIQSDSSKEPVPNVPISIDDESTPLSTEEIQSVSSSTSESEEVIDETPTNQSLIGLNAENILENRPRPSANTGQSANEEIQIISDDSQSVSSPREETSSQDDDEDDEDSVAMDMLEEQAEPVDLHVNRRETTTKVLPSNVQMDDVVIELSDSNSSHAPQEKVPTRSATPTVEAATEAPAVEQPSSSGAPAEVVQPKGGISVTDPDPAKETEVPVTTTDDAPSEAATVEPTPGQGVESPTEMKSAPEGGASISVETQAAPVETDSEQNKRQTLATEKQLESNSENGNQSLVEKILKKVEPETKTENREKQEAEVAAEGAAKQGAMKVTRLERKDEHSHAKEEVLPAAKRVTRKGSSVERITEASDSERPRRRGRKPTAEEQPILEDKEANMETAKRRGRKPSKEVDEANPEPETSKSNLEKPKRRGRKPSAEEAKDNEAKNKAEGILNAIEEEEMPSEQSKQKKELLPLTTEARPETAKRRGRLPSAEKNEPQKAKAQEIVAPVKEDHTVDSELRKPPKEVLPETSKRRGRPPSAEKEAAKDDTQNPKALGLLAAIKEDQAAGAGAEPMKPLKRTRKSSERVKTEQASQPTATKEDQTDAQADRPKRRGRKPSVDVELAAPDVLEKPRRRGQKADATADKEPALTKRIASAEPVDPHLEEITEEIEQEPEPKKLLLDEEEQKTRRRGRKPTTESVDVPEEHVEATSSRRRGRKATVEEAKVDQAEPKSKRHSAEGAPLEAPLPEIQEASTASVKPARRGRKPSVDVDLAEKKKPTRAVRKPSASIDEGTPQAKKTTARRGRKASAKEEGIDAQLTNQEAPTGIVPTVTATALGSPEKPNDGVYSSPSHTEDELTPRRREGRNIPRKNYTEVPDDDKPSSGSRRNRKPVTTGKAAANTPVVEETPTTPTPSQKGPPTEEPATATPTTPEIPTVTLPDPTTSKRREGRNLPRKNYTEAPDDDKPTPSRSRRQRNPTVKALELIVDTTPRPATPRRRKGKAGAEEPHEEEPPVKKAVTEVAEDAPAVATTAAVKGRGTRRKAEDVAEAESAEMEEAEPKAAARKNARGNARKAKVGTEPDPEAQPVAKKARGGARAKTPVVMISDGEQPEPTKEPVVAVAAKKPAGRGRGRAAKAAPIVEPEAEQPAPSTEAAAPSAPTARSGRAKKVHFEATPAVAEPASSNDEAPKRATRSRRK
ncbi:titin homolog [Drosophila obscura]|uniref:titin homolog n=1 Tax=Drosophila obscura TaxID=7282 RepID=UPI001BB27F89|nr:titin homolog [Drosophila obscura]